MKRAGLRSATGVPGLDHFIGGGFPKGSLILVAGAPGTGKTILSAKFLYEGAKRGEKVIYVSFGEGKDAFLGNLSVLKEDFSELKGFLHQGTFKILDLVTIREEGITATLNRIFEEIFSSHASRLVIDPFTALSQAFREKIDARIVLHTVLGKMVRQEGCTTIIVDEVPVGEDNLGKRMEEFVADAVIILRKTRIDGKLAREIEVVKHRGTKLAHDKSIFTLQNGFRVFTPFQVVEHARPAKVSRKRRKFKTLKHTATCYSSGWNDLDNLLGGFERGSQATFEVDDAVPRLAVELILESIINNFAFSGDSVLIVPKHDFETDEVQSWVTSFVGKSRAKSAVSVISLDDKGREKIPESWTELRQKAEKDVGFPSLTVFCINTLESTELSRTILPLIRKDIKVNEGLLLITVGSSPPARTALLSSSQTYARVLESRGVVLIHGLRPRTMLSGVELVRDHSGRPKLTLTPIC